MSREDVHGKCPKYTLGRYTYRVSVHCALQVSSCRTAGNSKLSARGGADEPDTKQATNPLQTGQPDFTLGTT